MTTDHPTDTDDAPRDEELERLRDELVDTDPAVVIANHCYGLFELGAVYLSAQPPRLDAARAAIDALAALTDALGDRLGEASGPLAEGVAQLRLAWVQMSAVAGDA
jgi:hypothetical protein